jgi:hypothetical protein
MYNDSEDDEAKWVRFPTGTNIHPASSIPDNNLDLANDATT